jgi:hypothetical protein
MQTTTDDNNKYDNENFAAKLATVLLDNNENEWETWKAVLLKEPFKSNMNSILFDVLKVIVYLDVDIGDVWYKYVLLVRPKLEEAKLVDKHILDENENKLKTILYASKVKFDLVSKLASAIGFKDYAMRRFEENPNKERILTKLTTNILGRKIAEQWELEIEHVVNCQSEKFIENDLVQFKTYLQMTNPHTKEQINSEFYCKGEDLKACFKLRLQEEKLNLRNKFENFFIKHNLLSDEFEVSTLFSLAYDKKSETTYQVISMIVDTMIESTS